MQQIHSVWAAHLELLLFQVICKVDVTLILVELPALCSPLDHIPLLASAQKKVWLKHWVLSLALSPALISSSSAPFPERLALIGVASMDIVQMEYATVFRPIKIQIARLQHAHLPNIILQILILPVLRIALQEPTWISIVRHARIVTLFVVNVQIRQLIVLAAFQVVLLSTLTRVVAISLALVRHLRQDSIALRAI